MAHLILSRHWHWLMMVFLLYRGVESIDVSEDDTYPPLLFAAVKSGNEVAVKALLENGAAPTIKHHGR